jgi:hypothetical protein
MSEGAEDSGAGTVTEGTGSGEPGTGGEDGAAELLGGMLDNDPDKLAEELEKWKGLARKHEGRAAKNAEAAQRLREIEDANKTELQKAQDAAAEAVRERDEARADHSRVMAAAAHNLPVDLIDYLGTGTDEEINGRAEAIAGAIDTRARELADEMVNQSNGGRNGFQPGTRPVESLRAGSAPSSGGTPKTTEEWFRQLVTPRE